MFTPAIDVPASDLLLQAMSSTLSGANNATHSLLKRWSQSLNICGHDIQEIIAKAKLTYPKKINLFWQAVLIKN
jgi:hypothetical protein